MLPPRFLRRQRGGGGPGRHAAGLSTCRARSGGRRQVSGRLLAAGPLCDPEGPAGGGQRRGGVPGRTQGAELRGGCYALWGGGNSASSDCETKGWGVGDEAETPICMGTRNESTGSQVTPGDKCAISAEAGGRAGDVAAGAETQPVRGACTAAIDVLIVKLIGDSEPATKAPLGSKCNYFKDNQNQFLSQCSLSEEMSHILWQ